MDNLLWRDTWKGAWNTLWAQACSKCPPTDSGREALELVVAALIYQLNAIEALPNESIHVSHRPDAQQTADDAARRLEAVLLRKDDPIFGDLEVEEIREKFGRMHLASASLRVPIALYLIEKAKPSESLKRLMTNHDWNRDELYRYLEVAAKNATGRICPCVLQFQSQGSLNPECIATILAQRDEFGHGELGSGISKWRKYRGDHFEKLPLCSLIEAQMNVIRWCLVKI